MMTFIKSNKYGTIKVRPCKSCGDVAMGYEEINGVNYEIILGYCGYPSYYAVAK